MNMRILYSIQCLCCTGKVGSRNGFGGRFRRLAVFALRLGGRMSLHTVVLAHRLLSFPADRMLMGCGHMLVLCRLMAGRGR